MGGLLRSRVGRLPFVGSVPKKNLRESSIQVQEGKPLQVIPAEKGMIHAVPELEGSVKDVNMTHEAAVGKIAPEEIEYLMARGLTSEEATAAIVRGFLDIEMKGVPASKATCRGAFSLLDVPAHFPMPSSS